MPEPLTIAKGAAGPALLDKIYAGVSPVDLTGASVRLRMRLVDSSSVAVDQPATVLNQATNKGGVQYSWQAADTAVAGSYVFWWHVAPSSGGAFDTDERAIDVLDHSPSGVVSTGAIARSIRMMIPATYRQLEAEPNFGAEAIQHYVDLTKYALFATVVDTSLESLYPLPVVEHAARGALLRMIPGAIDYWASQHMSVSTTGTNESASYVDRTKTMDDLFQRVRVDYKRRALVQDPTTGAWSLSTSGTDQGPTISHDRSAPRTPDPNHFPRLGWSDWAWRLPWTAWE